MGADVLIVGAGLAGLSCAGVLHEQGVSFLVLERSDAVGGRVRTDHVDGFLLDRGFQVLLTAYPAARCLLDYEALALQRFYNWPAGYPSRRFVSTRRCVLSGWSKRRSWGTAACSRQRPWP